MLYVVHARNADFEGRVAHCASEWLATHGPCVCVRVRVCVCACVLID